MASWRLLSQTEPISLKTKAFTIIEMMIVLFLIGLLGSFMIPRLFKKNPSAEWPIMIDEVNNLLLFARQEAISHYTVHRLHFFAPRDNVHYITIETIAQDPENPKKTIFKPVSSTYTLTSYSLHPSVTIDAVYLGRKDQLFENNQQAYCYIIPDGLVQEIFLHLSKRGEEGVQKVTFHINPFLGKFDLEEGHIKPSA